MPQKPKVAMKRRYASALAFATVFLMGQAQAKDDEMVLIARPAETGSIELGTGPLPGAAANESWHRQYGSKFARNVTIATLTPFLPDPAGASGAAIIVASGGGLPPFRWRTRVTT